MEGQELRRVLANTAYAEAMNKDAAEKTVYVSEEVFLACLTDMNSHHKGCIISKGFVRTYHKPFFTKNEDGMGKTYNHGIVHIVNEDSPINQEYIISNNYIKVNDIEPCGDSFEKILSESIKVKRHRLISLTSCDDFIYAKLTPQRNNFDD